MIKRNLSIGNKVSLQSLSGGMSGDLRFKHKYLIGKKVVESIGFNTEEGQSSLKGIEFIAQHPEARAKDLMTAIKGSSKLVIANIGGFDSHKLIPYLDPELIINNETSILGFSDITSLHLYFYSLGIQTYYGPSTLDGFAENCGMHELTKKSFLDAVIDGKEQEIISSKEWTSEFLDWANPDFDSVKRRMRKEDKGIIWENFSGDIEGEMLGGCLDTLFQIRGEEFFPGTEIWSDKVIFLETSETKMKPEIFRKALISMSDNINVAKAVMFGKPKDEEYFHEYKRIFLEMFNIPVVFNVNIGHTAPFYTIPYGGVANFLFSEKRIFVNK